MRLQLIVKSLKGDDLAREIITVLAQQYNVQNSSLCAAMRDGASVNMKHEALSMKLLAGPMTYQETSIVVHCGAL